MNSIKEKKKKKQQKQNKNKTKQPRGQQSHDIDLSSLGEGPLIGENLHRNLKQVEAGLPMGVIMVVCTKIMINTRRDINLQHLNVDLSGKRL